MPCSINQPVCITQCGCVYSITVWNLTLNPTVSWHLCKHLCCLCIVGMCCAVMCCLLMDISWLKDCLLLHSLLFVTVNQLSDGDWCVYIFCSDGLILFENLPYEVQNLDSAGPESLRQLDVEVVIIVLVAVLLVLLSLVHWVRSSLAKT